MPRPYQSLPIRITVLTPVHISTGKTLREDRDFYLEGKQLKRLDYSDLLASIPVEQLEKAMAEMKNGGVRAVMPAPAKPEQRSSIEPEWKQILRAKVGLREPQPSKAKAQLNLTSLVRKAEFYHAALDEEENISSIRATALDVFHRFALPGSTIKGAFRTALLVRNLLENPQRLERIHFTGTDDPLVAAEPLEREMTGKERRHPDQDIFRYLSVCDSQSLPAGESLTVVPVKILNLRLDLERGSTVGWKQGDWKTVDRPSEGDTFYWEVAKPESVWTSEILLEEPDPTPAHNRLLPFFKTEAFLPALNRFGLWLIGEELKFAESNAIGFLKAFYKDLLSKCNAAQQAGDHAYLPLGAGTPWHSKTIGGVLPQPNLEGIRVHFYHQLGKFIHQPCQGAFTPAKVRHAQCPKCRQPIRENKLTGVHPFPKTRKIVCHGQQPVMPLGWIKIERV